MCHFFVCNIFFSSSGYPINSIFQCQYINLWDVFDGTFSFLTIRVPVITKLFRVVTCGEELSPINTYYISTVWLCWVRWQIKYKSAPAECMDTTIKQGADIKLETLKHDSLTKWPTWGHVNVWKIYISIFMSFIANKPGRLLILGRTFITQTLKSSPTSCSNFTISQNLSCWEVTSHGLESLDFLEISLILKVKYGNH